MARKKQTVYASEKKRALERIQRMYLYMESDDLDVAERDALTLEIQRLAHKYGLQKLLRSYQII